MKTEQLMDMLARGAGCIVNMSSWPGKKGVPNHAAYAATKAAVIALTQSVAGELADRLRLSRSKLERDVLAGLPCLDVGCHDPRRRVKRTLRFSWRAVLAWYQERR